jgi:hypothetical protein
MHYGDLSDSMNMCQVVARKVGIKGKGKACVIKRRLVKAELTAKNKHTSIYGLGWAHFGDIFHTFQVMHISCLRSLLYNQ